jgi:hypothetical protein
MFFFSCSETEEYTVEPKRIPVSGSKELKQTLTTGDHVVLPLKERLGTYLYPVKNSRNFRYKDEITVVLGTAVTIKDLLEKLLFCKDAEGRFVYKDDRLILTEVTGKYDSETAIESSIRVFTELDSSDVYTWKYKDFKTYLDQYDQIFPWKKLRAIR